MFTNDSSQEIKLSGTQICAAGQLMGYSRILLPKDPYRGLLIENIKRKASQAQNKLLDKKIAKKNAQGEIEIAETFKKIFLTLGEPDYLLQVNHASPDTGPKEYYYYFNGKSIISLTVSETQYYLLEIVNGLDHKTLTKHIFDLFQIRHHNPAPGREISMPLDLFERVKQSSRKTNIKELDEFPASSDFDQSASESVSDPLSDPVASGSISLLGWQKNRATEISGVAFLETQKGLWVMDAEDDGHTVTIAPSSGADLLTRIETAVSNAMT